MNVIIALSMSAGLMSGALVNETGNIVQNVRCQQSETSSLSETYVDCVKSALEACRNEELTPIGIGISTKGEVHNGSIRLSPRDRNEIPLQHILEETFNLPTQVLNRFHAFALGTHYLLEDRNSTFGAINLSDGVGYGVVKDGQVLEVYHPVKGAGGLQKVKRFSDQRKMPIAQIAGANAIKSQANSVFGRSNYLLKDIFNLESRDRRAGQIVFDVADATARLVYDLASSYHTSRIVISAYSKHDLGQKKLSDFLFHVRNRLKTISDQPINIELKNDIDEDSARLVGAAHRLMQRLNHLSTSPLPMNQKRGANVFAVTGEPTSGKSTFLTHKILAELNRKKIRVGGMISHEVKENRKRIGFETQVFSPSSHNQTFELAILDHRNGRTPPEYIRFRKTPFLVNLDNINRYIVPALRDAVRDADVIVLDEVASMQLFSKEMSATLDEIIESGKPVIVTIPIMGRHPLIKKIRQIAEAHDSLYTLQSRDREGSQRSAYQLLMPRLMQNVLSNTHELSSAK